MNNKSPSGSLCPYYFMGGELHPLHYGSFHSDKKGLFEIINAEENFILNSFGINNRRIWIDLYETVIDNDVINMLVNHLETIQHKIFKICLVGCSSKIIHKLRLIMKQKNMVLFNQIHYFSDPEEAKLWLVGKINTYKE